MSKGIVRLVCGMIVLGLAVYSESSSSTNNNTNTCTYSISGAVTLSGAGLQGVTVILNTSATAITDASGNYSFTSLASGNYMLTSSKTGYTFTPTNSPQTVNDANIAGVNFAATAVSTTRKVPDTGQTGDYTTTFGEDSDYTINPMSFTDNGNETVTDNNTGLVWQHQDENWYDTYNWYQAAGIYNAAYNSSSTDVCGSLTLGGYSDWRLPNELELMSIVNYGTSNPAIDTAIFPNTFWSFYWSTNIAGYFPEYAWVVNFLNGDAYGNGMSSGFNIRCVRGGQQLQSFTDNGNGTITDNAGLMWQKEDDNTTRTWEQALSYCEGLELSGHSDWRLPNIKELRSIVDSSANNPAIDAVYFPNADLSDYWSSTTDPGNSAWRVGFNIGDVHGGSNKSTGFFVRCVRGGQ